MMMKKLVSLQGLLCSALLVACVPLPLQGFAAETGTLRGRFVYGATPPKRDKLNVNKDQDVCGAFDFLCFKWCLYWLHFALTLGLWGSLWTAF